jgi:hypothetical protein
MHCRADIGRSLIGRLSLDSATALLICARHSTVPDTARSKQRWCGSLYEKEPQIVEFSILPDPSDDPQILLAISMLCIAIPYTSRNSQP